MGLTSLKLGSLIELSGEKNQDGIYGINDVRGINNLKEMMESKADLNGRDLTKFQIVKPGEFVFNHRTSRNGGKFSITYNYDTVPHIFTEDYVVFHIKDECAETVLKEWLYLFFCRSEFDRFVITNSWGSSTEFYNWSDLCDIDITLPDIEIQRKYVNVFLSLRENLAVYQSKAEDLKIVCDGYIEDLRKSIIPKEIGPYLRSIDERNDGLSVTLTQGVDVNMQFIPAKREAEDQEGTKIVRTGQFAYNKVVKSNGTKLPIALREGPDCVISSSYEVFEVVDKSQLNPEYLMLWLSRSETHRQCGYKSYGTTRDVFPFEEMCKLRFPIPSIETQNNIASLYKCYVERQRIAVQLKELLQYLCPILIKGSLQTNN